MAADFIPTVMARGFHAGPVFGIFGPAVAAAKILRFTEDQVNSTIALCASLAAGNLEGPRSGGRALREGAAVRNAMLAVALAQQGHVGGETVLEGDAGFYHAYAGNNKGQLTYSFVGDTQTSLDKITAESGQGLDVPRDALPHLLDGRLQHRPRRRHGAALRGARHQIRGRRSRRGRGELARDAVSQPGLPEPAGRPGGRGRGARAYYTAYGVVKRGFPVLRGSRDDPAGADDPPEVLELMKRVTLIPSHRMTLFGPRITIYTKDGKSYTKQSTGREFMWDFDEEARRIRDVIPGLPIPAAQFEDIIATCRDLDRQDRADTLIQLTLKPV